MGCLIVSFLFYELYMFITALATLYCIYNPPAHFCVFNLHDSPHFHCQHAQLTLHILGKDYYHFTLVLTTTLSPPAHFCVHSPCQFQTPLYIKHDKTSIKPIQVHSHSSPSHPYLPHPQNISRKKRDPGITYT